MCTLDSNKGLQESPFPYHPFEACQERRPVRGEVHQGNFSSRPSHRRSLTAASLQEKSRTAMDPDEDSRWKVGMGHITIDDLVLVGLQHVSKGSWQCHLRLNRPL